MPSLFFYCSTLNPERQRYELEVTARLRAKGWTSSEDKLKWVVGRKVRKKFGGW